MMLFLQVVGFILFWVLTCNIATRLSYRLFNDVKVDDDVFEILTAPNDFSTVRENLEKQGITFLSAEVAKIPQNTVAVTDPDTVQKIQKMLDLLEENDDVQNVFHNADLPDEEEEE